VGSTTGQIGVFTFDDDFNLGTSVVSMVSKWRAITGMAFDPMDTSDNPDVYFSNSYFYHGESNSSSGEAVNGKVSKASGANLDTITDIITVSAECAYDAVWLLYFYV